MARNSQLRKLSTVYVADEPNPNMSMECMMEPETEPVLLGNCPKHGFEAAQQQRSIKEFQRMDAPWGLASMLAEENPGISLRIFLLDNSGSTSGADGHVVEKGSRGEMQEFEATRWEEICAMALDQAEWNARAGVRSEFILLNPPCPQNPQNGRDFFVIDPNAGNAKGQVEVLSRLLRNNGPRGATPLAQRLAQLTHRLQHEVRDHKRIMLTIVTDGLPTSPNDGTCTDRDRHEFVQMLRTFTHSFNSFVVIRLATDDDSTVDYYNKIDEELELPLDILDDLQGEAKEVHECGNGWFAYTPMIHRIREGGSFEKLFDLLDERAFKAHEISKFAEFLLRGPKDARFPREPRALLKVVRDAVAKAPLVYNGRLRRMTPVVDLKMLEKALGLSTLQRMKVLPARMIRALTCSSKLPSE